MRRWLPAHVGRAERGLAGVAVPALLGCVLLGLHASHVVLLSYLTAYLFWLAPALGSVGLLLIHALTGGDWGVALRPALLAGSRRLPLLALLLLPVLFGVTRIYPWAQVGGVPHDAELAAQRWYLNVPFFVLRAVVLFALWLWLAYGLRRGLRRAGGVPAGFAAGGLIVFVLSVSLAAVDWVMSLVPRWHSTDFGVLVCTGELLAAGALAVLCTLLMHPPGEMEWTSRRLNDLGSILLVLVLGWGYLAFMDYLTVWIADLPPEIAWYLPRLRTGWRWVGVFLVIFHLALPFAVLLSRQAKQRTAWLKGVAGLLFVAHLGFVAWLVLPGMRPQALAWSDPLALLGIGGLWWLGYGGQLRAAETCA